MQSISFKTVVRFVVLAAIVQLGATTTTTSIQSVKKDLNVEEKVNVSHVQTPESFSSTNQQLQQTDGRSMEATSERPHTSRAGRMLDLDRLAGDIGKEDKLAKERSMSGQRQSRILSEDISLGVAEGKSDGWVSRKLKSKRKMAINGFIPIVSLEGGSKDGKHFVSSMDSSDDDDDEDQDQQVQQSGQPQLAVNSQTREQLMANFGGQTSIGHASFGQPQLSAASEQQQQQQQQQQANQWYQATPQYGGDQQQQEAGRANRKLLGSSGILSGLAGPRRLVSSLVPMPQVLQPAPSPLQGPMNVPPMMSGPQAAEDCICVPFFQCKGGYLSESQLNRNQLQQLIGHNSHVSGGTSQHHQVPRSLPLSSSGQQLNDLYSSIGINQQQQQLSQLVAPQYQQAGQQVSSNSKQQIADDIYDQLRKNIESANLEQQLQQSPYLSALDERSKLGGQQLETALPSNSSVHQQQSSGDVLGRSLLDPFGRRSGGQQPTNCGIMRTCCKVPPTLYQRPPPGSGYPQLGPVRGHQAARLTSGPNAPIQSASSFIQPQPQYQLLRPALSQLATTNGGPGNQFADQRPPADYQPSGSTFIPGIQTLHQQQQPQQSEQSIRPVGSFMAGRCGTRQTLGIAGRVQNTQPAPGGESTAEFGEFPSHVAILKRLSPGDSLFVCSAVLISNQWLATAAHCVRKHRPDELKVRLGEWDVNRDDEFYPFVESNVREIIIHPDFQPSSLINDLALLRMDASMDPNQMPHIAPACLATPEEQFGQQRCWVAGWGKDAFGQGGSFQSVLKKVDLPVVARHECEMALRYQTKLGKFFRLHQSAICAGGERGKDACEGDGGSGLYCVDSESGLTKVVGLVSWGVGCGQRGVPGVYTNLATFYPWIESVVAASGEESLYLDRNGLPDGAFKNLVSERSQLGSTNGTLSRGTDDSSALAQPEASSSTPSSISASEAANNSQQLLNDK